MANYIIVGIHRDNSDKHNDIDAGIDAYIYDGGAHYLLRQDMVNELLSGHTAVARADGFPDANCGIYRTSDGHQFLKTETDGISNNNLSSLPKYNIR